MLMTLLYLKLNVYFEISRADRVNIHTKTKNVCGKIVSREYQLMRDDCLARKLKNPYQLKFQEINQHKCFFFF